MEGCSNPLGSFKGSLRKLCRTGKGPLVGFAAEGLGCLAFEFWGFRFVFVCSGFLGLLGFRYLDFLGV